MPRTLPWKTQGSSPAGSPARKRQRLAPPSLASLVGGAAGAGPRTPPRRSARHSPPSSPATARPEDAYMRSDGRDDCWRLVEDELLAVAHSYTQHLHHAEYRRLQAEARAKKDAERRAIDALGIRPDEPLLSDVSGSDEEGLIRWGGSGGAAGSVEVGGDARAEFGDALRVRAEERKGKTRQKAAPVDARNPWLGTTLSALLVPARGHEELIVRRAGRAGANGVRSRTRAAMGYGAAGTETRKKGAEHARREIVLEPDGPDRARAADDDDTGDDDDLGAPQTEAHLDPSEHSQTLKTSFRTKSHGSGRSGRSLSHGATTDAATHTSPKSKPRPRAREPKKPSDADTNEIPLFLA